MLFEAKWIFDTIAKLVQTCVLKAINLQTVSQGMFSFSTEIELSCNIILVPDVEHSESIF